MFAFNTGVQCPRLLWVQIVTSVLKLFHLAENLLILEKCLWQKVTVVVTCYRTCEKLIHCTSGSHFKAYGFTTLHKFMQMHLEAVRNHISLFSLRW